MKTRAAITSCRQCNDMSKLHVLARVTMRYPAVAGVCLTAFACARHSGVALDNIEQRNAQLASAETVMHSPSEVTFQTLSKGSRSGVRDRRQVILRSQAEWNALWAQHVSVDMNPAPPPTINFATDLVVAVFLGEQPTGGSDVVISRAQRSDGTVIIYFRERAPAPGAIVTQSLTQPFHIVRINNSVDSMVSFRREP